MQNIGSKFIIHSFLSFLVVLIIDVVAIDQRNHVGFTEIQIHLPFEI